MTAQSKADHFVWDSSGKASIDGYDLAELAKRFPTPFYLISQGQLRDNYRRLRQAFASVEGLETYYSVKSNFESIVLRTLADEGCGAEISGALDMELAKRAGMPPNKVVFDGPVKPEEDLRAAIEWGVRFINIESMNEARMISRIATEMGKKVKVGLRIDPQLSKPYYDKVISTYKEKFGLPIEQAEAAVVEIAKLPGLDFKCIMTHIGSQIFTPSRYIVTIEKIFNLVGALAKRGIEIEEINMGGGYPAQSMRNLRMSRRFVFAQVMERFGRIEKKTSSIDDFGAAISGKYHELVKSTGLHPRLALEPGRCLCANAQTVVGNIKIVKNDWVFTDISINDVPENLFFSEWRLVVPGEKSDAKGKAYNVAGPTLATQDVLYFKREVPGAAEGRAVCILDAGAYSIARANQFTRPRSAVYAINLDGEIETVRRAETVEEVLVNQVWPDREAKPVQGKTASAA
jgi:diaminopimelate decarboxylase